MQVHWSDWVGLGLMVGIAIFMTGWYVREHITRRRVSTNHPATFHRAAPVLTRREDSRQD